MKLSLSNFDLVAAERRVPTRARALTFRGALLASLTAITVMASGHTVSAQTFRPVKPPAAPLIVRQPYINTWLETSTDKFPGQWPRHWNGTIKAMTGIAYIDGKAYLFLGDPSAIPNNMIQTDLKTTPTQSVFTFAAGGVQLNVDFLSPVEYSDLKRLSEPLGYISTSAQSTDGAQHAVSIYFDISGEWANGDSTQQINWAPEMIGRAADGSKTGGALSAWTVTPTQPAVFTQVNDYPSWGTVLWATAMSSDLTIQSGQDIVVRGQFVANGHLTDANDNNQPRAINNNYPVFAFSKSLGTVGATASKPFTLEIGHVREPALNFLGTNATSLWMQYWPNYESMLAFAYNDAVAAFNRARATDATITKAATALGGPHYAALTALTLRQAFASTELTGTPDNPYLFVEEISSSDNVQTVDILYPSMPVFLYTNPDLVRYMIEPVIFYSESGQWPNLFAPHDLGATYPNATGHNDGGGENMPVEETANMLIMADAYMQHTTPANAAAYAKTHYKLFNQWAQYLLTVPAGVNYPNALDPQFQNQTDDFTGQIAHSVNLALKGIVGVGAMGQIAAYAGRPSDAEYFGNRAKSLIATWAKLSQNSDATHLLLQYRERANAYSGDTTGEPDSYWSLKYNAYPDKLLGLNLIPPSVLTEEANWYKIQETPTGIQLDPRMIGNPGHTFTKADWELWTAAASNDPVLVQTIIDEVFTYANTTHSGAPFPDLYDPNSDFTAFEARAVMGGAFAPLTVGAPAK